MEIKTMRIKMKCLNRALVELKDLAGGDIPLQHIVVFLAIAEGTDRSILELGKDLNLSQSSVSRAVAALGKIHSRGKPGLGWVSALEDPMERRRKVLRLTAKGEKVMARVAEIIEKNS